jgi:hypothetical protein
MAGAWNHRRVQVAGEARYVDTPDKNRYSHVCEAAQYLLAGACELRRLLGRDDPAPRRQAKAIGRPQNNP